jgi:CheY-like chemotaxis protein
MEDKFFAFKKLCSIRLVFFFNIIQIVLQFVYLYLNIVLDSASWVKGLNIVILAILLIAIFIRNKLPLIIVMLNIIIADFQFIFNQINFGQTAMDTSSAYIFGMLNGAVIYVALLSIKIRRIRLNAHVVIILTQMIYSPHVYIAIFHLMLFFFYMEEERAERRKFLEIYEYQNNLKNF